jgi:hypothetical protein
LQRIGLRDLFRRDLVRLPIVRVIRDITTAR